MRLLSDPISKSYNIYVEDSSTDWGGNIPSRSNGVSKYPIFYMWVSELMNNVVISNCFSKNT